MTQRIIYILVLLIACFKFNCKAEMAPQQMLDSATAYYNGAEYAKAVKLYEQCIKSEGYSAAILINLGNAYVKTGDYGKAYLNYERALKLTPSDKELKNNIAFIQSKVDDANKANAGNRKISILPEEPGFFSRLGYKFTHSQSSNVWAWMGGISFVILCICIALYYFCEEVNIKKTGFFGAGIMLLLCAIFNILAFTTANAANSHESGVIVEFKSTLTSEPMNTAPQVGVPLSRGTKMQVLETECNGNDRPEWYKVRLNSDIAGWIKSSEFEII